MIAKELKNVKLLAGVAGGAAVVALGLFSAASGPATMVAGSHMNTGQTSVQSTPPTAPMVSMAVPAIKGPAPLPSEEKAAQ